MLFNSPRNRLLALPLGFDGRIAQVALDLGLDQYDVTQQRLVILLQFAHRPAQLRRHLLPPPGHVIQEVGQQLLELLLIRRAPFGPFQTYGRFDGRRMRSFHGLRWPRRSGIGGSGRGWSMHGWPETRMEWQRLLRCRRRRDRLSWSWREEERRRLDQWRRRCFL